MNMPRTKAEGAELWDGVGEDAVANDAQAQMKSIVQAGGAVAAAKAEEALEDLPENVAGLIAELRDVITRKDEELKKKCDDHKSALGQIEKKAKELEKKEDEIMELRRRLARGAKDETGVEWKE